MVLGVLPSVAYLVAIKAGNPAWIAPEQFARLATTVDGHGLPELAVTLALGNGFIITSMLWISTVVAMLDGRLLRAAGCLLVAAALALFGLRSEEHTSELQSLMRISYAVLCLKQKKSNMVP